MKKITCARCGRRAKADKFTLSRHTRRHYCLDVKACERRHAKLKREGRTDRGFVVEVVR